MAHQHIIGHSDEMAWVRPQAMLAR